MYIHKYIRDPVRLRLRHLYQVEFCSFIVGYPSAGASVYCGHISSSLFFDKNIFCGYLLEAPRAYVDAPCYLYFFHVAPTTGFGAEYQKVC